VKIRRLLDIAGGLGTLIDFLWEAAPKIPGPRQSEGEPAKRVRPRHGSYVASERQFQPKLNTACVIGRSYLAKVAGEEVRVVVRELGVVEGVEHL
jgi:hypothetical protein